MVGREILAFSYGYMGALQCCFCASPLQTSNHGDLSASDPSHIRSVILQYGCFVGSKRQTSAKFAQRSFCLETVRLVDVFCGHT